MHFARLANTLLKDEKKIWQNNGHDSGPLFGPSCRRAIVWRRNASGRLSSYSLYWQSEFPPAILHTPQLPNRLMWYRLNGRNALRLGRQPQAWRRTGHVCSRYISTNTPQGNINNLPMFRRSTAPLLYRKITLQHAFNVNRLKRSKDWVSGGVGWVSTGGVKWHFDV